MPQHRLRILHISDLHERVALRWMHKERKAKVRLGAASRHRVLGGGFLEALRELRDGGGIDLVCFTGDAADWGLPQEYEETTARFDQILQAAGAPRERLFLVPGNHDVNRRRAKKAWQELRRLGDKRRTELSDWMAGLDVPAGAQPRWRSSISQRSAAFWRWVVRDLGRTSLDPKHSSHKRLGYRVTLDDMGLPFPTQIIGLDSAWLCGDDNDAGKLLLTQGQVDLLTTDPNGKPLPGFRLALAHHPLSFLADESNCFRLLADTVDLLLHGHQHDAIAGRRESPDRSLRSLAAGSLYEGDKGDRWINSFHLVEAVLDDQGRPLWYDIEFWGWSERGHWHRTGAIYRAARDGLLCWWTPLGEAVRREEERKRRLALLRRVVAPKRVFVGREEELAILKEALLPASGAPQVTVICNVQGMAGVGKTWLVEHFYDQHRAAFPGGLLRLVLDPASPRTADELIGQLADAVKLPGGETPLEERLVRALRLAWPLVHVENVDSRALGRVAVAFAGRLPGLPVAISGRFTGLRGRSGWRTVALQSFDAPTGAKQLSEELDAAAASRVGDADRDRLVGALGGLPLAIHLAGGYLNAGYDVDAFRGHLRKEGLSVQPFDENDDHYVERAEQALSATLDLSLSLLEEELGDEAEDKMAALLALGVAPRSGFGLDLGAAIGGLDRTAMTELLTQAASLSVIERVPAEERPDGA